MYTMKEAEDLLIKENPGYIIESRTDYKNLYVFSILPKDFDTKRDGGFLDGFYSVNKKTGEISGFAPWDEPDYLEQTYDMSVWD